MPNRPSKKANRSDIIPETPPGGWTIYNGHDHSVYERAGGRGPRGNSLAVVVGEDYLNKPLSKKGKKIPRKRV